MAEGTKAVIDKMLADRWHPMDEPPYGSKRVWTRETRDPWFDTPSTIESLRLAAYLNTSERQFTEVLLSRNIFEDRMVALEAVRKDLEADKAALLEALEEARDEIEYWHADYLTSEERNHPRGNGWARVYDHITALLSRIQPEGAEVKAGE